MYSAAPYSISSLANVDCTACETSGKGLCSSLYLVSGKCESKSVLSQDTSFCSYIDAIKILRNDGSFDVSMLEGGSIAAGVCVGIFTAAAVGLTGFAVYLKKYGGIGGGEKGHGTVKLEQMALGM